jgi:hypothetical protein
MVSIHYKYSFDQKIDLCFILFDKQTKAYQFDRFVFDDKAIMNQEFEDLITNPANA